MEDCNEVRPIADLTTSRYSFRRGAPIALD